MFRSTTCCALILFASAPCAQAATYYVDRTLGNDANNGTSPTSPWRSVPGMAGYSGPARLNPGDTVYFDSADTWDVGGGSWGLYLVGGVTYIGNDWGTGTRARIRATTNFEAGLVRFKDHPTVPTVFKGFEVDANGKAANGIDVNTGYYQLMNGANKRIENNIVHGVFSRQSLGQYNYGIIVSNHGGASAYCDNVEIVNNVVHNVSRSGINLYPGDENGETRIRNMLVRGNEVYDTGTDPDYFTGEGIVVKGYVVDAIIEYNHLHDTDGTGIMINSNETNHFGTGPKNIHIRYNIVTNSTPNGAILIYDKGAGNDPKDVKIYGNIVHNSTVNGGLLVHSRLVGTVDLQVFNNTFYNAPVIVENSSAQFRTFEFRNNLLSYASGTPLTDPGRKITAHSDNLFYRSGGGTLVTSGSASYTSSTLGSYEASAISASPAFKNTVAIPTGFSGTYPSSLAPDKDGLSLQAGSVALNAATTLPATYAGSINSVTRPATGDWDLGAYESGSGAVVRPLPPTDVQITN